MTGFLANDGRSYVTQAAADAANARQASMKAQTMGTTSQQQAAQQQAAASKASILQNASKQVYAQDTIAQDAIRRQDLKTAAQNGDTAMVNNISQINQSVRPATPVTQEAPQQTLKQNTQSILQDNSWSGLTPPAMPTPTGNAEADAAAQAAYQSRLNAYAATVESRRKADQFTAESSQQAQQQLKTSATPQVAQTTSQIPQSQQITQPAQQQVNYPQQLDPKTIVSNPQGYKQFQQEAAQNGYVYNDQGQLTSSSPQTTPEEQTKQNFNNALESVSSTSMEQDLNSAQNLPSGSSAATLIKQSLLASLGVINDPSIEQQLDDHEVRAQKAYESGLALVQTSMNEIDKAIDGTLTTPSTSEGLLAKVYSESKEDQLSAIKDEQDYQEKQHNLEMSELRANRANLEGYAKAKLESMGALDSSAGITMLSKMATTADIQIQKAELDYDHSHQQLVLEGNKIMKDFTNNVADLVMKTNSQKATVQKTFTDTIQDIEDKRFTSEQQKKKDSLAAYQKYSDDMQKLDADNKKQQFEQLKFAYQQHQDAQDNAYKMSGMMGTIYVPDGKGGFMDTGIQTFDNKKNQQDYMLKVAGFNLDQQKFGFEQNKFMQTYALDVQKFQLQKISDNRAKVSQFLDLAKAEIDPNLKNSIEQMMMMPQGTLDQFGNNKEAIQGFVNSYVDQVNNSLQQLNANSPQVTCSPNFKQVFNVGGYGGQCGTFASTLSTATRVGNTWQEKRRAIDKQDNPQPGDKLLIPAGVKSDGSGWGHVAVVTGYDPNTGNINVVHSNWNMDGKISTGVFNVNQLNQKYKGDWGFASGTLKPQVLSQLQGLSPEDSIQSTFTPKDYANTTSTNSGLIDFTHFTNAASSKPPTDSQALAAGFAVRSVKAESDLNKALQNIDVKSPDFAFQTVTPLGNFGKSKEVQEYEQAGKNFISAVLRKESGAAISNQEYENEGKKYLPQPGDSPEVLQQKAEARKLAIQNLKFSSGPAYAQYEKQYGSIESTGNNFSSMIQQSISAGAHKDQIINRLITNPEIGESIQVALARGATPDEIIQHYLNN